MSCGRVRFEQRPDVDAALPPTPGDSDRATSDSDAIGGDGASPRIDSSACGPAALEDNRYECTPVVREGAPMAVFVWQVGQQHTCAWLAVTPSSGLLAGTPRNNQVGSCNVDLRADDGAGAVLTSRWSVSVENLAPTLAIGDAPVVLLNEGRAPLRADADVQASDEGSGFYALVVPAPGPACATFGELYLDLGNGAIDFSPLTVTNVPCQVTVRFDDGNGGLVDATFQVPAIVVNQRPTIVHSCSLTLYQDEHYTCQLIVNDPDPGDIHTWSVDTTLTGRCSWASIDPATGLISGTPTDDMVGSCRLSFKVSDAYSDSSSSDIMVTVVNLVPTLDVSATGLTVEAYDEGPTPLLTDAQVQSNEEGFGNYAFSLGTAPSCGDLGDVNVDMDSGALSFDAWRHIQGVCYVTLLFDDRNGGLASDEVAVNVTRTRPPGSLVSVGTANLVSNPGCEEGSVLGDIPAWTELGGTGWHCNQEVWPREGLALFFPGSGAIAELEQFVDVSALAATIDAGTQQLAFRTYVHSWGVSDTSRVVLEYLDASRASVLATWDSGEHADAAWLLLEDIRTAPMGTRCVRIHLISTRVGGSDNDGYYDYISLSGREVIL